MTIRPTAEEIHDRLARATPRPVPPSPWIDRVEAFLCGCIVGGVAVALILIAIGRADARPTICANYHGAECVAAIEEGAR